MRGAGRPCGAGGAGNPVSGDEDVTSSRQGHRTPHGNVTSSIDALSLGVRDAGRALGGLLREGTSPRIGGDARRWCAAGIILLYGDQTGELYLTRPTQVDDPRARGGWRQAGVVDGREAGGSPRDRVRGLRGLLAPLSQRRALTRYHPVGRMTLSP